MQQEPSVKNLTLTRQEAREIDRRAEIEFGMSGLVLMENAGRGVADKLCELGISGPVVIACGKGNNGGDGFVIARHLDLRGHAVKVLLWAQPSELTGDAAANYYILSRCNVPLRVFGHGHDPAALTADLADADWIVDALLGTGSRGEPRPPLDQVIRELNASPARRLAVDLPSGLDCDTGRPAASIIRAHHTCTFVAPKAGFLAPEAQGYLGEVHVLDIGAPRCLVQMLTPVAP